MKTLLIEAVTPQMVNKRFRGSRFMRPEFRRERTEKVMKVSIVSWFVCPNFKDK